MLWDAFGRISHSSPHDDCTARTQTRPVPGRPAEQQIVEKLEEMAVMASVLRIQKTADGIIAARNAAARLCKLCSFIATGVDPRQPKPTCHLYFLLLQVQIKCVGSRTLNSG